jgi:hypothetical protein
MQQKGFVVLNQSASWNAYQEETALARIAGRATLLH